ncbi:hypothetical protein LEP1GSC074_3219 [Leptospira noguchii str. Hook]|nr:hypothetical protein LEP1GSC074_3219 [Leptospira noguchii str. Hook]
MKQYQSYNFKNWFVKFRSQPFFRKMNSLHRTHFKLRACPKT